MNVQTNCDYAIIQAPYWFNPDPNGNDFWTVDSSNTNRILISTDSI